MPSAASISSDVSIALSRGAAQWPQSSAPQTDSSPFAALLDAATATAAPTSDAWAATAANEPTFQDASHLASAANAGTSTSAGNTLGTGAQPNAAPAQSANAGASSPSEPTGNGAPGAGAVTAANGAAAQSANAIGALKGTAASRNPAHGNSGKAVGNAAAKVAQAPTPTGDGSAADATSNGNANSTISSPPAASAPATPDSAANDSTDTASDAAVAAAFNAALNANGLAAANSGTPGAGKTPGGKDDQNNDAADPASDSSSAMSAQLPSLSAAQPVAVAIGGNAAANAAPVAAKTGSTVTDVLKGRAKTTSAAAPVGQNTPAQASDADPAASASTTDSGGTDGSTSAALDPTTGDNSASTISAQQTPGQPQTPGAATTTLLTQIGFASSGGAEQVGARAEATALNGAGVSAAPAASANATIAPNFGVFATNAMTTNGTTPAAAGSDTPVPLAGLAVAIAARAQGGSSQFDIRLDPPELGRIDVRLGVDGSGQVTTHVTVDRADTLQLLQSQQPQLQQALEQAGLKTADNGLQFTLRDQSFTGQNGGSGGQQQQAPPPQVLIPQSDVAPIDTAQIYARLRLGNGLDIRV